MGNKCYYQMEKENVAVVYFDNPPLNALDTETMEQFESVMKQLMQDNGVHVIVLTGKGSTFVVGADVNAVKEVDTYEKGVEITSRAQAIVSLCELSPKPVIALINGLCLGGGMEIALACHMRIAATNVQMGLPEIMLGIIPAFGGTQRSARLLGNAKALEIMLTGMFITMDEALRIGLVNRVYPAETLMEEGLKIASSIAKKGQVAVRAIVEAVMKGSKLSLEEGLKLESTLFGKIAETHDKKEGIEAFLEKRKPQFKHC
ncbi:MAG: enoyl-CoA hydratase-related protein [Spirochaetota bacterium]